MARSHHWCSAAVLLLGVSGCGVEADPASVEEDLSGPIHINFQPTSAATPAGYLADDGSVFGSRGSGHAYGWNIDNRANARERDSSASPDKLHDTLIHMQKPGGATVWELTVPNGAYSVHLVSGDPDFVDSAYAVDVEGVVVVRGTPTASSRWVQGTATVTVADGRLTVSNARNAVNNKIDFIDVTPVAAKASDLGMPAPADMRSGGPVDMATARPADLAMPAQADLGTGGGTGGTHEPAAMTTVWSTGALTAAPVSGTSSGGPVPLTVQDVGAQGATGTVTSSKAASTDAQPSGWRVTYPAGKVNDPAGHLYVDWTSSGHLGTGWLYVRYKMRLQPGWTTAAMNSGDGKLWAPKDKNGTNDHIIMAYLPPAGNLHSAPAGSFPAGAALQGPVSTNIPDSNKDNTYPAASDLYQAGVWNTFEVLFQPDSPAGAGNGAVTIWINGALATQRTGLNEWGPGTTPNYDHLDLYASRSQYSGVQAATTYLDIDDIYVSVK